ncbi:hypothetical protein D3C80_991820 [compost metagenome]
MIFCKERRPCVVHQHAVGLQRVMDRAALAIFLAHRDDALKKGEPHEGRFAPLPGKEDWPRRLCRNMLLDIFFQRFLRHFPVFLTLGIERFFFQIKTVLAINITY